MIHKLLIANRGEIACRIIRTCRKMGIRTVAVYSDADANSLAVEMADEAVHIGNSPASESYLVAEKLIAVAKQTGAQAIHPGFGFLAENATFAQAVADAGLIFIGPTPSAIEAMGKKRESKLMLKNVPMVAGYNDTDQADSTLIAAAEKIGYPIMVKASAGGGGKGMRRVESADGLSEALATARREAKQAFGDDTLILEHYVTNPRHIEIQIFGDTHGNVIAFGERECSIQRRHQKVVEETPSTALDDALRAQICATAVSIGQQLGYISAGTIEFLLDDQKNYYFMEMNTRLQVEHPVTEMVFGVDLVELQLRVAGEAFDISTLNPQAHGHAIEVRVYAEDPANDFLPVIGDILRWQIPQLDGLRVDSGIRSGDAISPYYDPMIAKIITYGVNRNEAIRKLDYALAQTQLLGLRNNINFLRRIITHPDHVTGNITTGFIDQHPELLTDDVHPPLSVWIGATLAQQETTTYWRNNAFRPIKHTFTHGDSIVSVLLTPQKNGYTAQIGDKTHVISAKRDGDNWSLVVDGHRQNLTIIAQNETVWWIHADGQSYRLDWQNPLPVPNKDGGVEGSLRAPMPGQVIKVQVEGGQHVKQGDVLMILEAMKMEHRIIAPYNGVVSAIRYNVGQAVQADSILLELHAEE
ncbi:MAG: biotin carboxylase N-terminal domain-containing protein [bacterium]|nr:biotin carboxylase N-terminal domain-containing protein [bacterium]